MTSTRALFALPVAVALAGLAVLASGGASTVDARQVRNVRADATPRRQPPSPVLAIVGLKEQRISIYDTTGARMLQASVSSGAKGYETPAGIYSVVQKEEEHHSNLYDDASMPFMQRITWTGMAMHTGVLPGYPASHGCVRLPGDFAERLYQITNMGLRVVVVREDMTPAEIAEPALFKSKTGTSPAYAEIAAIAKARLAEAETAAERAKEARLTASKKAAEAAKATQLLRAAELGVTRAEGDVQAAERALQKASTPANTAKAEDAKSKALARLDAARAQLEAAKLQVQPKTEAAARAEEDAQAAATTMNAAIGAAEEAKHNLSPVSVLISRKTQRLYIRKNNYPVFEAPVIIRDADKPIGTFVFTALNRDETSAEMRWNVVSMYKDPTNIEPYDAARHGHTKARRNEPAIETDAGDAQAALDRLEVSQEAIDRISAVVLPGSSLIISDESPSIETGKDTDFVLFMSGEPQGGIAIRSHAPIARGDQDDDDYAPWRTSTRRRSSGGGFLFFFPDD